MDSISFLSLESAQKELASRSGRLQGVERVVIGRQAYRVDHGPTLCIRPATIIEAIRMKFALNLPYALKSGSADDVHKLNQVIFQPRAQSGMPRSKQPSRQLSERSPSPPRQSSPDHTPPLAVTPATPVQPRCPSPSAFYGVLGDEKQRLAIRKFQQPAPVLASERVILGDGRIFAFRSLGDLRAALSGEQGLLQNIQYLILAGAPYRVDMTGGIVTGISHGDLRNIATDMGISEPLPLTAESTLTTEYHLTFILIPDLREITIFSFVGKFPSFEECRDSINAVSWLGRRMRYLIIEDQAYRIDPYTRSLSALGSDEALELEELSQSASSLCRGNRLDADLWEGLIFPVRTAPMPLARPIALPADAAVRPRMRPLGEEALLPSTAGLRSSLRRPGAPPRERRMISFSKEVQEYLFPPPPPSTDKHQRFIPFVRRDAVVSSTRAQQRLTYLAGQTERVATVSVSELQTWSPVDSHVSIKHPLTGRKEQGWLHANRVRFYNQNNKPCIVAQTMRNTFTQSTFWRMLMQQKVDVILDYTPFASTRWGDDDNIPRSRPRVVDGFRITPQTLPHDRTSLRVQDLLTKEERTIVCHHTSQWLAHHDDPHQERRLHLKNTLDAAYIITRANTPAICCRSSGGAVASTLVASTIMDMDRQCPITQRAHQNMIETAILKLRKELDPRLVDNPEQYIFLYAVYDELLNE